MYNRWMEVNPKDIIWSNLDDGALEMKSRYALSWVATIGLIVLWAFPVGFIGTLSNLSDLCERLQYVTTYLRSNHSAKLYFSAGYNGSVKVRTTATLSSSQKANI
jgi:hypothetical protein